MNLQSARFIVVVIERDPQMGVLEGMVEFKGLRISTLQSDRVDLQFRAVQVKFAKVRPQWPQGDYLVSKNLTLLLIETQGQSVVCDTIGPTGRPLPHARSAARRKHTQRTAEQTAYD